MGPLVQPTTEMVGTSYPNGRSPLWMLSRFWRESFAPEGKHRDPTKSQANSAGSDDKPHIASRPSDGKDRFRRKTSEMKPVTL
ncbi:unnamed protein product [Schistocephalus solidus]|uniref:Uncharacterized protein n=1 Tax=Schistocephalus solidus TaxID=70667 RepID=A0A183SBE2_SCHSO|nr:unnamed protein product [Schistocephalus solidus]